MLLGRGYLALVALAAVGLAPVTGAADQDRPRENKPLVIGHRGAHGYLPAHTLEGYALAIELGADYVEPDLVMTRDGHLIARHEPNMIATTNVKDLPQFAGRKRPAVIDGAPDEGWFASDFTLAEIKQLRAVQDFGDRPQQFNGKFEIPTLDEIIELVKRKSKEKGRVIGIYPETKHPTYHQSIGLPLEGALVDALKQAGWNRREAPVFIQSFEQANLKALRKMTPVRLVQLVDANDVNPDGSLDFTAPFDRPYDWTVSKDPKLRARFFSFFATDEGLREIRTYADGIGPWKRYIVSTAAVDLNGDGKIGDENGDGKVDEADRKLLPANDLIGRAHRLGLLVHTWTFRNVQKRLPSDYQGNPVNEYLQLYALGIDGVFSDFADAAVSARVLHRLATDPEFGPCFTGDANRQGHGACRGSDD
jgi:glycerophosphoryl diester phosphodiesterase